MNSTRHPILKALVAIILWSTQALFLSQALEKADFSSILFPAFLSSSLFFIIYKILHERKGFSDIKGIFLNIKIIRSILLGIIFFFCYHIFFFWGMNIGSKVETNLSNFLWPLFFVLFGYIIFNRNFLNSSKGKRVIDRIRYFLGNGSTKFTPESIDCNWKKFFKIIMAFWGFFLMVTHGHVEKLTLKHWEGPLLGFIAAVIWAFFSIFLKFLGKVRYMSYFIGGTTILSGILWIYRGCPNINLALGSSIYLGLFPLGIAMIAWEGAMKNGHTQEIGILTFLAPLCSTLLLVFFKLDYINWFSLIGCSLIVFANIDLVIIKRRLVKYLEKGDVSFNTNYDFQDSFRQVKALMPSVFKYPSIQHIKIIISYFLFILLLPFKS